MEITREWCSPLNIDEIKEHAVVLDETYDPHPSNTKEKIPCKLYYLKSKDLFIIMADTMNGRYYTQITSELIIGDLRVKHFKESPNDTTDGFLESDNSNLTPFS